MENHPISRLPGPIAPVRPLQKIAQELETAFLTEMLKAGGFGASRDTFGGGAGEDAFSSLLLREQAGMMVESGGIGLAEAIVQSIIKESENV